MVCVGGAIQRILIPCSLAQRDAFPAIADSWFEMLRGSSLSAFSRPFFTSGSRLFLVVPVDAPKYRPVWDKSGDEGRYRDISSGQFARLSMARYGFEVDVELPRIEFVNLLHRIRRDCLASDLSSHTPITVLDFVKPTWNDAVGLADGTRYTARTGRIIDIQEKQGNARRGAQHYGGAFTLSFQERRKRVLG